MSETVYKSTHIIVGAESGCVVMRNETESGIVLWRSGMDPTQARAFGRSLQMWADAAEASQEGKGDA